MDISSLENPSWPPVESTHPGLQRHKSVSSSKAVRHTSGAVHNLQSHTPPPSDDYAYLNFARDPAARPSVAPPDEDRHASASAASSTRSVVASLYESPEFNNLPQDEIEDLIAEIIREDGFMELLEKVNQMWRVKAFVNS